MKTDFTRKERQILANQFEILSHLDKSNSMDHLRRVKILQEGYELDYYTVFNVCEDEHILRYEHCQETRDILNMFRAIQNCIRSLSKEERASIDLSKVSFEGFDANDYPHYHYATFLIKDQGRWEELSDVELNSHSSLSLDTYKRMLKVMNERLVDKRRDLSIEDLNYIIEKC